MENSKAIEIIKTLADGVDPSTGEVFAPDSPYQNANVIRALHTAKKALEKAVRADCRRKNLPSCAGKPWDEDESNRLIKQFDAGIKIVEIAKTHERTKWAIESQLQKLGKL